MPSSPAVPAPRSIVSRISGALLKLLASYGLAVVVLFWLLVLTALGTWEQKDIGLYEAQRRYFTSLFVLHDFGRFKVPLPGVYLLLVILTVNLITGTLMRIRKRLANLGLMVIHLGMLILMLSALVTHYFALEGHVSLAPGQSADHFASYNEWELAITDFGSEPTQGFKTGPAHGVTEHIVPLGDLTKLAGGKPQPVLTRNTPFTLRMDHLWRNGEVKPRDPMVTPATPGVNGFYVMPAPLEKEVEKNLPAAHVTILMPGAGADGKGDAVAGNAQQVILWGASDLPYIFDAQGGRWGLALRRRTWPVPFSVALREFRRELHPGTEVAKSFESDVTRIEGGQATPQTIRMNEPLRHEGYTFFQASFQQNDQVPGGFISTFAVVKNPADQWPLYACIVITCGMLLHFALKLGRHLNRRTAALILICTLCCGGVRNAAAQGAPETVQPPAEWPRATLEAFARWPIQDQGRIKPLSTFARFKLVKFSGRSTLETPDKRRLEALPWLLETMFYADTARDYKVVRVENPAVMQALGLADKVVPGKFSFGELLKCDEAIARNVQQIAAIQEKDRDLVQQQILNLYDQYNDLGHLLHALDFTDWRMEGAAAAQVRGWIGLPGTEPLDYAMMLPAGKLLLNKFGNQPLADAGANSEQAAAQNVLAQLDHLGEQSTTLAIIPPQTRPDAQEWFSPGTLLREVVTGKELPKPELALLRELENLPYAASLPGGLAHAADALGDKLRVAATPFVQPWRLDLEIFFYRAQFFYYGLLLFILSFVCVALSWLATPGSRAARMWGRLLPVLVVTPTVLLIAGIMVRCVIRGRPPVSTLYETTLFVPAVAITVALAAEWITRKRIALATASAIGVLGLFLATIFELKDGNDTMTSLVAVLNSNFWLATHVVTVNIGYSACLLAAGLGHVYIFAKLFGVKRREPEFYRNVTRMTYGVVCFGTLFSFVGTVLGGIWANYSWGRFWGWDPKENSALAIIIWNLIILHARLGGYVRELGLNMLAVFGGILLAASWWGVNQLGVGLHSYGFTAGIVRALFIYWAFELVVLGLGSLTPWLDARRAHSDAPATPAASSASE